MKAKVFAVLAVLAVLAGGIIFYRQATSPVALLEGDVNNNFEETTSVVPESAEPLPPAGRNVQAEASVIVSDIISAAVAEAASYSVDEENFLLDDAGDLDTFGQAITVQ